MTNITYETEHAIFTFNLNDVTEAFKAVNQTEELVKLFQLLTSSPLSVITIPEGYTDFGYIALDLLAKRKGSVICKICNKIYHPKQLKPITVGHGTSPFHLKEKGGIKKLLKKGQRLPGLFGGHGFTCPKGHELLSMTTWQT